MGGIMKHFDDFEEKAISSLANFANKFTPFGECDRFPEINRKLTSREIKSVNNHFLELDLDGFIQNSKSADTCFIPNWNK